MKRKLFFFLSVLFFPILTLCAQCNYCKGTGRIVKNITTSNFGLSNDSKKKCQECGEWHLTSTGHHHVNCPYCRGGRATMNSSGKGYKSKKSDYVKPEYVLSPEEERIVRNHAQNLYDTNNFGIPIGTEEQRILDNFKISDNVNYVKYLKWRNELNLYIIDYNKSVKFGWVKSWSTSAYDKGKKERDAIIINLLQSFYAPQSLRNIAMQHMNTYENAFKMCRTQAALHEAQNKLDDMILRQNMLYFY